MLRPMSIFSHVNIPYSCGTMMSAMIFELVKSSSRFASGIIELWIQSNLMQSYSVGI